MEMKKKILLIITFMMLLIIPGVKAEGNMKVIFNTSFEEQIDINKIDKIFIMMDDVNRKDYEIVLEHKDNFHLELNNIPQGNVDIASITVSRDYTVGYDYEETITRVSDEETVVSILVKKVIKDPNRKKVDITNDYIAEVLGLDPMNLPTTNNNTTNKIPDSSSSTTSIPTTSNNDPVVITSSEPTTTTLSEEEIKKIEKKKREEDKKQGQQKRKSIYLIVLLVVIAVIIVGGVIVGIKIANANK